VQRFYEEIVYRNGGRQEWVKEKRDGNTEFTLRTKRSGQAEGRTQRALRYEKKERKKERKKRKKREKKEKREGREEKGKREERLRR
jgi:hypothetical protein